MQVDARIDATVCALRSLPVTVVAAWGSRLAAVLSQGRRLLVLGNGGSAAQAQHMAAELVGRYRDDRRPFSAIALPTDVSSLTGIGNDYDFSKVFSRQVEAHGRAGDLLLCLSTSGRSPNVVAAAAAGRSLGLGTLAFTGPAPNPLHDAVDEAIAIDAAMPAVVQETHQVALHLLCEAFEEALSR